MASSPSFELQELINENRQWVQTYGNSTEGLKTSYTDILSTNYISDGKTLNTTVWLYSGFSNSSSAYDEIYNAPDAYSNLSSAKLSYGILIDSDANTRTGYNGADYDFYAELYEGKLNVYLYQLSSTGGYKLVGSKSNLTFSHAESPVGPGYANLNLDLSSIGYPSEYNLLFYSAESIGSNEVRQFTNWVTIPPPSLEISTSPSDISIRQGEEQMIPARIKSTSGFSNDVINITLGVTNNFNDNFNDYIIGSSFNSSEFDVHIQRNQPPLIKIGVPNQTLSVSIQYP